MATLVYDVISQALPHRTEGATEMFATFTHGSRIEVSFSSIEVFDTETVNHPAACIGCGKEWNAMPFDFIYDDPAAGWRQDISDPKVWVSGWCRPCANEVEASRPIYGGRDSWQIEARTMEDERFIWDR